MWNNLLVQIDFHLLLVLMNSCCFIPAVVLNDILDIYKSDFFISDITFQHQEQYEKLCICVCVCVES